MFEEEHPLGEGSGNRNITIYHTAGPKLIPIREQTDVASDIYTFTTFNRPNDEKSWEDLYKDVENKIAASGET